MTVQNLESLVSKLLIVTFVRVKRSEAYMLRNPNVNLSGVNCLTPPDLEGSPLYCRRSSVNIAVKLDMEWCCGGNKEISRYKPCLFPSVVDGGSFFVCHFKQPFSGQKYTSVNLPGLRLYLCSLVYFKSFTFWYISIINLIVYWVSVNLYGSYECILIDS